MIYHNAYLMEKNVFRYKVHVIYMLDIVVYNVNNYLLKIIKNVS
jgi:hypothetical protein